MSIEKQTKVVSAEEFYDAVDFVSDYLWEEERETYEDAQFDGEPRRCCYDELQVMADWLLENKPRRSGRCEDEGGRVEGFSNFETRNVLHWLVNDPESRERWREQAKLAHIEDESDADDDVRPHPRSIRRELAGELARTLEAEGGCSFSSLYTDLIQLERVMNSKRTAERLCEASGN